MPATKVHGQQILSTMSDFKANSKRFEEQGLGLKYCKDQLPKIVTYSYYDNIINCWT